MKNIGIIGGAGFLGTALQRKFRDIDVDVECYDLSCSKDSVNYMDVGLPMGGSRFDTLDSIVNLAAEHRDDVRPKSRYDYVNIEGRGSQVMGDRQNIGIFSINIECSFGVNIV